DESAIVISHGLQAGLGEMMMIDANPDTEEEFDELLQEQIASQNDDIDVELLGYTKEIGEDRAFVAAYMENTYEEQPTFYNMSYMTASENVGYVLEAVS